MSDTDSFIDEVTEEVRRERLYGYVRRYGWIGVLAVVLIVGGAAWNEYRKAQTTTQAEALGDQMLGALTQPNAQARAAAIGTIEAEAPRARAALDMMAAPELAAVGETAQAVQRLDALALDADLPEIYRQIAGFKALLLQTDTLTRAERRAGFAALAVPGQPLRLLAQEQMALIDVEGGDLGAARAEFQRILVDAETSADLQQRAMQAIVALGGEPDLSGLVAPQN